MKPTTLATALDLASAAALLVLPPGLNTAAMLSVPLVKGLILDLYTKRKEACEAVLRSELRHVSTTDHLTRDPQSFMSKALRLHQAAMVGTAHANLRILARLVIADEANSAVVPDDFLYLASIIESLRYDELVVLAAFIRASEQLNDNDPDKPVDLAGAVAEELPYPKATLDGLQSGLSRTGLIYTLTGYGAGGWYASPTLKRLEATVQFCQVVTEEKSARASNKTPNSDYKPT